MAQIPEPDAVDTRPAYTLLAMAVLLNGYFFFLGTACVRLWFYQGALGPEPEKFIILRKPLKGPYRTSSFPAVFDTEPMAAATPTSRRSSRASRDPQYRCAPGSPDAESSLPCTNTNHTDALTISSSSPSHRALLEEERRISRLPAFVQDDCGAGSDFPGILFAISPIEAPSSLHCKQPKRPDVAWTK